MHRNMTKNAASVSHAITALISASLLFFSATAAGEKEAAPQGRGCLGCHKGIEVINPKMASAWQADKRCEVCHGGRPAAATKLEAHAELIANPGDLRVIDHTCGKCHSDYGQLAKIKIQGIDNHVGRVMRSLMATAAGEIAGTRYMWNEQETRSAVFGVRAVSDLNRRRPDGAVEKLRQLPPASASDADSLLRGACLRCHLWTEDKTTPGVFRPAGCSACHVLYAEDGLSRSGDPCVSKAGPGHPIRHEITTQVPDSQCLWCHNNGGVRIGLSYVGLAVVNPVLTPSAPQAGGLSKYGASVMHVTPDVHHRRGIACIDCHDSVELHGDGNIYSHQEYQVGIRCESCHGSWDSPPEFRTEHGRKLASVEFFDGKPYLRTKILKERRLIPTVSSDLSQGSGMASVWHEGHRRLECYACHSKRVPQCYACHVVRDDAEPSPVDWVVGIGEGQAPEESDGKWMGQKLFQLWDDPVLGFNRKGRISPLAPGGQAIFTHLGPDGADLVSNHTFTTPGGLYGFSMSPIQPHNIRGESRTCPSCHSSRRALGLGSGIVDLRRLGLPTNFSPDRIVDEEGNRIQDSPHEGVRPFNREELADLLRTETCIVCHEQARSHPNQPLRRPESLKGADTRHQEKIENLLGRQDK